MPRLAEPCAGRGSTRAQLDEELADIYAFLLWQFGDPQFQPSP